MKKNKTSQLLIIILFSIGFILSVVLVKHVNINTNQIADNSFLFTFLGIFLGFALTIFTFIVSMVDKIKDAIQSDKSKNDEQKENSQNNIISFYSEIKDDIFLIFYFFVIVIFISLFENVNIPYISFNGLWISKVQFIISIKLEIFLFSLYAIYDLTSSAFKISEVTGVFRK